VKFIPRDREVVSGSIEIKPIISGMADNQQEEVADYQDDEGYYGEVGAEHEGAGVEGDGAPEEFDQSVAEMDEELERLTKMQQQVESQINSASDKVDETSM
jgi:hypothetical protein